MCRMHKLMGRFNQRILRWTWLAGAAAAQPQALPVFLRDQNWYMPANTPGFSGSKSCHKPKAAYIRLGGNRARNGLMMSELAMKPRNSISFSPTKFAISDSVN